MCGTSSSLFLQLFNRPRRPSSRNIHPLSSSSELFQVHWSIIYVLGVSFICFLCNPLCTFSFSCRRFLKPFTIFEVLQILWGLYFLIMCIGTEWEKVRQHVTDYKFELEISVCMLVNFEFRIFIWNFEFWLWISNFDFDLWILILNFEISGSMSTRGVVSV